MLRDFELGKTVSCEELTTRD